MTHMTHNELKENPEGGDLVRPAYSVWLDEEGRVFNDRSAALLELVRSTGSLSKAAAGLGVSYSGAWYSIKALETNCGVAVLERRMGGRNGGGCKLTTAGEELLCRYHAFRAQVDRELQRAFAAHLGDWPRPRGTGSVMIPDASRPRAGAGDTGSPSE